MLRYDACVTRILPLCTLLLASVGLVAEALPAVDQTRNARAIDSALMFAPDGEQLRLAATGLEEPLADLLWLRTVLLFGANFGTETDDTWIEWLRRMVQAVNTLDPRWRTAYFYGGSLLRVSGDIDGADGVFRRAREHLPEDPFFPFSLGMNAYLYRDAPVEAGQLLGEASRLPGAPPWYAAAAAAMKEEGGQRAAGIRFLEEVRQTTDNPAIREDAERQLGKLRHNALVATWAEACRAHLRETGRPLSSPEDLVRLGFTLPENPRGDAWMVAADGVVRSQVADAERYRRLVMAEMRLIRR
jgi:tetratricopeptide (TPR) repeat protein